MKRPSHKSKEARLCGRNAACLVWLGAGASSGQGGAQRGPFHGGDTVLRQPEGNRSL